MNPSLTWLDLTTGDRDAMRRVLDLFSEQGTVDELGLGSLRDAVADGLFPGTSTIQTRLAYMLFIPWIYLRLEEKGVSAGEIVAKARKREIALIKPLTEGEDLEGIIGIRARASLSRLPSSVYWAGLVRWGIFLHPKSQGWYHVHFDRLRDGRGGAGRADDPGVVWTRQPNWNPRIPSPPQGFPWEASFLLRRGDADFLLGRILESCHGTLLAYLADAGKSDFARSFWDDPSIATAPPELRRQVEFARRFSLHVEGAPLLYNLLLAERTYEHFGRNEERVAEYRELLEDWGAREAQEAPFQPAELWSVVARSGARSPTRQRRFVETWTRLLAEAHPRRAADAPNLCRLIEAREAGLKGPRARLRNPERLSSWKGASGVGRMDFRWHRVRVLLSDLQRGLDA